MRDDRKVRMPVAYFWCVGWWAWSLGFHVSLRDPNIEIHVPFGFFRIGWQQRYEWDTARRFGFFQLHQFWETRHNSPIVMLRPKEHKI